MEYVTVQNMLFPALIATLTHRVSLTCYRNTVAWFSVNAVVNKVGETRNPLREAITYSVALVRERTMPTEGPPPVGEVIANFCGYRGVTWSAQRIPTAVNLCFLDRSRYFFLFK